jgi:hypothetical protein
MASGKIGINANISENIRALSLFDGRPDVFCLPERCGATAEAGEARFWPLCIGIFGDRLYNKN